ncbi:WXG100 family type VII secretion target [Streptacidiphilus sp. PB12-B1b]|uniref:WXG100 family type VII secretion target n=1 Tax=Streptacidiphilus sp. PB12-B1b TaxID=2705012 RepID=UPI0015F7A707|nr:WXG100 family type VII secretion target [Streptacidiphilus sp. PB12-B1b]QMU77936.1 WXG100 family type VII secretion target [Streptacidiphilus sp. PB12-B1b]
MTTPSGSGSVLRGDPAVMAQGAQIINGKIGEVKTILVATNEAVTSLSGGWTSDAASAFTNIMGQWDQDMVNVIAALERIEAQLTQTKFSYDKQQYEAIGLTSDFARTLSGLTPQIPK